MKQASRKMIVMLGVAFALTTQVAFAGGPLGTMDVTKVKTALQALDGGAEGLNTALSGMNVDAATAAPLFANALKAVADGTIKAADLAKMAEANGLNGDGLTALLANRTDFSKDALATAMPLAMQTARAEASAAVLPQQRSAAAVDLSTVELAGPNAANARSYINTITNCGSNACKFAVRQVAKLAAAAMKPCHAAVQGCSALRAEAVATGTMLFATVVTAAQKGIVEKRALNTLIAFDEGVIGDQLNYEPNRTGLMKGYNRTAGEMVRDLANNLGRTVNRCVLGFGAGTAAPAGAM